MSVAGRLTAFANTAQPPENALQIMRLSLFDWAAVAIAGQDEPVAQILREVEGGGGGRPDASVVGLADRLPAKVAALINGATSHALDYDDTHFDHIGHPSVAVIPATLAVAEMTGATGDAMVEAALIGAEASVAVGVWLGRPHYQTGFHQTATAGAFGATLAACKLLKLNENQINNAFGLVSTRASGLKSQFGTMGKPLNAGIAASNGVEAALLAAKGMTSDPAAIDGAQGFGPTHAGVGDMTALDTLGREWRMLRVSHKFHACCHGLHAMLEALRNRQTDTIPDKVIVHTHPRWLTVCNQPAPETGLAAKFSYRFTAALALSGYDTGALATYCAELCQDLHLQALRDRVEVRSDGTLTEMQARVDLVFSGESKSLHGDLNQPLGYDQITERLRAKATALLGLDLAERLFSVVRDGDLPALSAMLRGDQSSSIAAISRSSA